jgi:energy-coupling factor transport system permease protein
MIGGFASIHPGVAALYFGGILVLIMWLSHPAYLLAALVCMLLLNVLLDGGDGLKKSWRGYLFLALVVMVLNPLFSSRGATILGYFRNRPITRESMLYGITFALTLVTMLLAFQAYQRVITVDKFLYLTGSVMPRTAFVIVMIMRLIPLMQRRLKEIAAVAKTLSRLEGKNRRQRIRESMEQINTLLVWTLEESLHTATAMRASGYDSGPRSSFQPYRMECRDYWLAGILFLGGAVVAAGSLQGLGRLEFFPVITGMSLQPLHYTVFLLWSTVPIIMETGELIQWQVIKSKM